MVSVLDRLLPWGNKDRDDGSFPPSFTPYGTSGTDVSGGYFDEEYLQTLKGSEAAKVFDKMRRSDAQVKMLTSLVKNPILSAKWVVEPVDDTDEEVEVAEFIEHVLFKDISYPDGSKHKTWRAFLKEALSFVDFGHSVFEIVHKVVNDHPKWGNYIGLKDLAFRSQKTLEEWVLRRNGSIKYIRQQAYGDLGTDVNIRGDFALVFSNDKEGDNYEGISLLRPIYGNYFRKNHYRKIQATGLERGSMGVPYAQMSSDVKDKEGQFAKMMDVLKRFRTNPNENLVTPSAFEIDQLKLEHDSEKLQKVIDGENSEMSKAFLATFMEMGINANGGAYSLGTDISDIFLSGIVLYADEVCESINLRIVKQLIDMKFGFREEYPKLRALGINDKAGKELAEIVGLLSEKGLVQSSDRLIEHMHKTYGLPDLVDDEDLNDGVNDNENEEKDNNKKLSETIKLAEPKGVSKLIVDKSKVLEGIIRAGLKKRSDKMISQIELILRRERGPARRTKALKVKMPGRAEYANELKEFLASVGGEAKSQVLGELDIKNVKFSDLLDLLKDLPPETRRRFKAEIDLIMADQEHNIEKSVFFTLNNELDRTDSVDALIKEIKGSRDRYVGGAVLATASKNFVSNMVNGVRNDVFQTPEVFGQIESFVFKNTNPKSDICKNLNGRVFSKEEYKTSANLPPLHHNCDSYIEAQTSGSKNNKPVDPNGLTPTGTPEEVEKIIRSKSI